MSEHDPLTDALRSIYSSRHSYYCNSVILQLHSLQTLTTQKGPLWKPE